MRLAVTGATGFLGRRVVALALEAGDTVRALVRQGRGPLPPHPSLAVVPGHLEDPSAVAALVEGADVVLHLAASGVQSRDRDWSRMVRVNVVGPVALVEASAKARVGRLVAAGTCLEYAGHGRLPGAPAPEGAPLLAEDAAVETGNGYGATKAAGGLVLRALARERALPCWYLRIASLLGPGDDPDKLLPAAVDAALDGRGYDTSGGEQVREWLHVDDAARAVLAAARRDPPGAGAMLNVGTGEGVALRDAVRAAFAAAGAPADRVRLGARPYAKGEVHRLVMDPARARALLEWAPLRTFDDALAQVVAGTRAAREREGA